MLLGRGAAGGGGGAYASNTILVTPGTTLNVVVASQTAGTTGAGVAGGNSTITGFESSILAAGGSGGDPNNAGGSPVGGIGGTTAASAGSIKFAGANGGNGNSWNLLGLLLSSGPGGAGAGLGGAGGTAVSGLLLSNAPGNAGSPPGGAGSGAINSALGASQIGGAGAAGRVIITYSCANFNLTNTNATSICASAGTTSSVTITGSTASLPVGNYIVTYNRSSPAATSLTANLTVSTAGTGTFVATGLTTAGSSTITITKLTSESCSSNITTNNTATVTVSAATVAGTVNGGTTINSGSTSGLLTLSGHTGSVVKWQSAVSPFSTWTDIVNTNTTYTSGVLTETTQFRAVAQNGVFCAALNSAATTVTVNPRPTIALAVATANVCTNELSSQNTTLSYSATTGNPVTYSVVWDEDPTNSFFTDTDVTLPASPISIYVPIGTSPGTYTGTLTVKDVNGNISINYIFTLTVNGTPAITTNGIIDSVYTSSNLQNASLPYSQVSENPTSYSIDWDADANTALLVDQGNTPFVFTPSGGVINTIQIPANVPAGSYSGRINISNGNCAGTRLISIKINELAPTITLLSPTIDACSDFFAETRNLTYTATTGNPTTYSIVWDIIPANNFVAVTNAALPASSITINVPGSTTPGTYTGILTVKNAGGSTSLNTPFTIIVSQTPTLTTAGFDELYTSNNAQNASLAYSESTGNPISYSISWSSDAHAALLVDQGITPFNFAANGGSINNIFIPANLPAGLYSGIIYIYNEHCQTSRIITLPIDDPAPTITLASSTENICSNLIYSQTGTTLSYTETTGEPVTYSIVWNSSPGNSFAPVTDEVLPASPITIEIPVETEPGTYTGTLTVKNANDSVSPGSVFTLTVNANPTITTIGLIDPVYTSSSTQNATLTYSAVTNNPSKYSIIWEGSANAALLSDQDITPFDFAPNGGVINTIVIPSNVLPGDYYGTLIIQNEDCDQQIRVYITINNPAPTIALDTTAASRCYIGGGFVQTTTLNYGETTGNPTTYSIVWNSSPTNNFAPVTDVSLPASPITIVIPDNTLPGIYTGTLTVKNANGVVSNLSSTFTVTIDILGLVSTNGQVAPVVSSSNSQITSLAYSGYNANFSAPTKYYIDWNEAANIALLVDQPISPFAFNAGGGVINTIEIPANVPPGTYLGKMYITNETTCLQGQSISITINSPAPTIVLSQTAETRCSYTDGSSSSTTIDYTGATGNPTTYSIVWDASPINSFAAVTDAALSWSPITLVIPGGTAPGTYTGTLTVKNANGVASSANSFTVTVNQSPSLTLGVISSACSSNNPQVVLTQYTAASGTPTSYSIDWNQAANDALLQDKPTTSFNFVSSGGYMLINIDADVLPGTYSGTIKVNNVSCSASYPISVTITTGSVGGTVTGGTTINSGSSSGLLTLSGNSASVTRWQSSVNPFTTWTNIVNTNTSYTSGPLTQTTQFRAVVQGGTCFAVNSEPTTVTVLSAFAKSNSETETTNLESAEKTTSVTAFNQVINIETINQTIDQVFVYDVSGNLLYKKNGVSNSKLVINSLRSSNQVLVVKVVLNDNRIATKKVIY